MTHNPDARGPLTMLSGLRTGTHLGGYRLLRRLGAGGMGVVWEVVDDGGRHVAMKILHPQIAADPMARRRLDREASVLARVRDSRVARILDIETGESEASQGVTFVITELVDGPTLQHEVDHEGVYELSTDARDLADLAHGLVTALRAVHDAGVIHRDLKPSNVMLGAQGPVLIDFGIAQVADDVRLTQTGQVTGTPGFIPPEMLDGGEPTPEVDWYACAGVLLFTVTGRAPFGSGAWQTVFRRVYAGTPELGDLEEECPALARAFTSALAPRVENRIDPEDLLAVLDEIAEGGSGQEAVLEALGPALDEEEYAESPDAEDASADSADPADAASGYGIMPAAGSAASAGTARTTDGAHSRHPASSPSGSYGYISSPGRPVEPSTGSAHSASTASASSAASAQQAPPVIPPRIAPGAHHAGTATPPSIPPHTGRAGGQPAAAPPGHLQPQVAPPSINALASPAGPHTGHGSGAYAAFPGAYSSVFTSAHTPPGNTGGYLTGPLAAPQPAPLASPQPMAPVGAASRRRAGALPAWAREPQRHPGIVATAGLMVLALGHFAPFWMMIIFSVVVVIMGTVGRAQDALRWNRLQRGSVSSRDTSRMWAMSPWYFLRSLLATAFGAGLAAALTVLTIITGANVLGFNGSPTILTSWSWASRAGVFILTFQLTYILALWFVPWGTPARRGAAHLASLLAPSVQSRRIWVLVMVISALIIAALRITVLNGILTLGPFYYSV